MEYYLKNGRHSTCKVEFRWRVPSCASNSTSFISFSATILWSNRIPRNFAATFFPIASNSSSIEEELLDCKYLFMSVSLSSCLRFLTGDSLHMSGVGSNTSSPLICGSSCQIIQIIYINLIQFFNTLDMKPDSFLK